MPTAKQLRASRKGKKQLAVWIPEPTMKRLKRHAKNHKETLAGMVEWCIEDSLSYLEQQEAIG